jgi:hypothetical protein
MAKTAVAKSKPPARRAKTASAKAKTATGATKPRAAKPRTPSTEPKRLAANTKTAEAGAKAAAARTKAAAKPKAASKHGGTERKPPAGAPQGRQTDTRPAADDGSRDARAKIRMYRHGLGDCFLIALPRKKGADPYRILIDCGVILGTADVTTTMTNVVEDIVQESGGKIDLLLATHQHWDHLSGFIQAADSFAKLKVGDVWLAWTEDPKDDLANKLRSERHQALASLRLGVGAMRMAGDADGAGEVEELIGFFGAAGGASTEDALAKAKASAAGMVRYCLPTDPPISLGDPDVKLFILGPPHDEKLIRQTLSSAKDPETYGIAAQALAATVMAALSADDNSVPFGDLRSIPAETAAGQEFFQRWYFGPGADAPAWRQIDTAWLDGASELALALDSATNNTSLVLAIELAGKDVLLFAADAQVGNWLSWQDRTWTVDGRTITGPDLLARTIFYKVGHHGSHNATLREKGLEMMKQLSIAAIPVDHNMAVKKRWGNMPLPELIDALSSAAKDGVLRSDVTPPKPPHGVVVKDLYFDIVI